MKPRILMSAVSALVMVACSGRETTESHAPSDTAADASSTHDSQAAGGWGGYAGTGGSAGDAGAEAAGVGDADAGPPVLCPEEGPEPIVIAAGQAIAEIRVQDGYVYWIDYGAETISRVPVCGGETEILATVSKPMSPVVVVDGYLYWQEFHGYTVYDASVLRASLLGGEVETLATHVVVSGAMVGDSDGLYWSNADNFGVWKLPFGSEPVSLWAESAGYNLAQDESTLFAITPSSVLRIMKSSGEATTLYSGADRVWCVAIDDVYVYATGYHGSPLVRFYRSGGGSAQELAPAGAQRCLAVDDENVYWLDDDVGLRMVPKAGGVIEDLTSPVDGGYVALDAAHVFWASRTAIMRRTKPGL